MVCRHRAARLGPGIFTKGYNIEVIRHLEYLRYANDESYLPHTSPISYSAVIHSPISPHFCLNYHLGRPSFSTLAGVALGESHHN